MKHWIHVATVLAFVAIPVAAQDVVEQRMSIRTMVGEVSVRSSSAKNWRPARVGMPVRMGWDVRTFVESSVEIEYETGTMVKIGENSVVTLSGARKNAASNATRSAVKVATGELWADVKKLTSKKSSFTFETPTAVASIRGTRLGITVDPQGATRCDVYHGAVAFRHRNSTTETVLTDNMRGVARPGKPELEILDLARAPADSAGGGGGMVDPFGAYVPDSTADSALAADSAGAGEDSTGSWPDTGYDRSTDSIGEVDSVGTEPADSTAAKPDTVETGSSGPTGPYLEVLYPRPGDVTEEALVVVTGKTRPAATVSVGGTDAAVGGDGVFAASVDLKRGANAIKVTARTDDWEKSRDVTVQYHPPLVLTVNNLVDKMKVTSQKLEVDLDVTEGARFAVNGLAGQKSVSLRTGENKLTVSAWDEWGNREEQAFSVVFAPTRKFVLNIVTPSSGDTVREPMIPVSGSTSPGASVTVNGARVTVGSTGFFTHRALIPAEPGEYDVEVVVEYDGEEMSEERIVVYQPRREPLKLSVSSPAEGQTIRTKAIRVAGVASPTAEVTVGDIRANVSSSGAFTAEIPVSERDIGDYTLEIAATDEAEELTKSIGLVIDAASPMINTSMPVLTLVSEMKKATRQGNLLVQVVDRTPDDEMTIRITNNGSRDEVVTEPGSRQTFPLDEGKNEYKIVAYDRAGNASKAVTGAVYYLPGPLTISIVEPAQNPLVIRGLPPMPMGVDAPVMEVEVEVDDGIGDVPETIKYCALRGNGRDIILRRTDDYLYEGEVELETGRDVSYTVYVEDLAGTVQTKAISVRFVK